MKYEEIILNNLKTIITNQIKDKKVKVALNTDFEDQREPYMVAIGCSSIENMNPHLMDYRFTIKIVIDFFIEDDKEGYFFKKTRDQLYEYIQKHFILTRNNLSQIEEGIVYCGLDNYENMLTESSNRCQIYLQLVGSWDPE